MAFYTNYDPVIRAEGLQEGLIKGKAQGSKETLKEDRKKLAESKQRFFEKYKTLFCVEQKRLIDKEIQI